MRKLKYIVLSCMCICLFGGCGVKEKLHGNNESGSAPTEEQTQQALKEEQEILENTKTFETDAEEIYNKLKEKCDFLKDGSEKEFYTLENETGSLQVMVGEKDTAADEMAIETTTNEPFKDEQLKKQVLSVLQIMLETIGETYDETTLLPEMEKMKLHDQVDAYPYSDRVSLFLGKERTYFVIRISPIQ